MNSASDVPFRQWALIYQTERTTVVTPLSGYRRRMFEDDPRATYLEPNPTEEELGRAVLESLNISRFVDPRTEDPFF
jgi:CDI immunity protein